ncbi:hypothetical protein NW761_014627 [Fusarium oxysporum]|nr:hypothetical protein NW753_014393 [Fusarium oxysporum]KAJ4051381.1 hypothetical protein NW758_003724 [Fusarium oxysporum]KAJ4072799.1 hypothetical protein NW761_014627 [Fusarium oxysporum]KAJ4213604.1 hypothetical protein NW760_015039 [Fusarium oxysporum]
MKLHQVTAILAFVAAGVLATPDGYADRGNNNHPAKNGDHGDGGKPNRDGSGYYPHPGSDRGYHGSKSGHGDYNDNHADSGGRDHDKDRGKDRGKDYDKDHDKDRGKDYDKDHDKDHDKDRGKDRGKDYDKDHGDHHGKYPGNRGGKDGHGEKGWGDKCKKYNWDYSKATYSASFNKYKKCPAGDSYKVSGKIAPCDGHGYYGRDEQCLFVTYDDWDKWSAKTAYLGIYATEEKGFKEKKKLNFNKYCKKNKCVVPVKKIPGYPGFKDSVWIGYDDDQCKQQYWGGYGHGGKKNDHGDHEGKHDDDKDSYDNDYDEKKDRRGDKDNNYGEDADNYDSDDNGYGSGHGDYRGSSGYGSRYGRRSSVKYVEVDVHVKYAKKCHKW